MNAFTIFLNKLIDDPILRNNSWITVINHNETSIPYFEERKPDLSLIDLIIFRSGSNDFDNPLFDAIKFVKRIQMIMISFYFTSCLMEYGHSLNQE